LNDHVPDDEHPGDYIEETAPARDVPGVDTTGEASEPSHPGVFVEETPPGKPIQGVQTEGTQRRGYLTPLKSFLLRRR
jgi:hypothetical protein